MTDTPSDTIAQDAERWITTEEGHHVLINSSGKVEAGAGGSLTGVTLSSAESNADPNRNTSNATGSPDRYLSGVKKRDDHTPEERFHHEREDLLIKHGHLLDKQTKEKKDYSKEIAAATKQYDDHIAKHPQFARKSNHSMDGASARHADINGYVTVKRNPISRSGIFQYSGAQIGLDAEPDKIYNVYRPAEEWQDPDALESVKHVPWIDDHIMLGGVDSEYTSPDQKGVHGITCDEVSFEGGTVYANLKIFSRTLADLVARGKRELSLGFRCAFEKASGVFDGQSYDYCQRHIRANHLALVDRGRAGSAVAVLDHTTAFDHFDLAIDTEEGNEMSEANKPTFDMAEITAAVTAAVATAVDAAISPLKTEVAAICAKIAADEADLQRRAAEAAQLAADEKEKKDDAEEKKETEEKKESEEEAAARKKKEDDEAKEAAMDRAEVARLAGKVAAMDSQMSVVAMDAYKSAQRAEAEKTDLVSKLVPHIGVFDHSEMSKAQVADYGVEKLKIPVDAGSDKGAVLRAYLHNRPAPNPESAIGLDDHTGSGGSEIDALLSSLN